MVGLRGDEAIRDPSGGREGGGGDGFAVQSGHVVIVSISDALRACQAAVFGFHDIGERARRAPLLCPCTTRRSDGRQMPGAGSSAVSMEGVAFFACRGREL